MELSPAGLNLIKSFEGFSNESYLDSANIPTIGYGTIRYPSGAIVALGQECTEEKAIEWLKFDIKRSVDIVNSLEWQKVLKQCQFDALVSFQYNTGHLAGSTLYRKAKANPDDVLIYYYNPKHPVNSVEFLKWVYVGKKIIDGLVNRRMKEADIYGGKNY